MKRYVAARKAGKEWLAAEREKPGDIDELGAMCVLFMLPDNSAAEKQKLGNELFERVMKKRWDERYHHVQKALISHCSALAAYFATSEPNKTKQCLLRALELSKSAYGLDSFETGIQLKILADCYVETQQFRAAVPLYEHAAEIFQQTREVNPTAASEETHCQARLVNLRAALRARKKPLIFKTFENQAF